MAAWGRVVPKHDKFADKRRSRRSRKGNRALRATLADCATGTQFEAFYKASAGRGGYNRTIIVTAHKMLLGIQAMLGVGASDRDPGFEYERLAAERNVRRWLCRLKQFGYLDEAAVRAATQLGGPPAGHTAAQRAMPHSVRRGAPTSPSAWLLDNGALDAG